ncbi:MAG: hypothetical protein MZV63_49515 [Marinilabiliales bacterium]|nr:hypothetical protein [Marinilabiliales bacterium]
MLSDRGGFFTDLTKTFVHALGSPNYFNHDAGCAGNVHNAALSIYGIGPGGIIFDYQEHKTPGPLWPEHCRIADGKRV